MPAPLSINQRRRGVCPTLDTPLPTGDGLLARIRVAGGRLTSDQLITIAQLAQSHGNGLIEITARGNLQLRGLTPVSAPLFAHAVTAIITVETGLVVETPPFAGNDPEELADPHPLATAIRVGSAAFSGCLGPKVTVIVDGCGQLTRADLKADLRLIAATPHHWRVAAGDAVLGTFSAEAAIDIAIAKLSDLAARGPLARFPQAATRSPHFLPSLPSPIGPFRLLDGIASGVVFPFGVIDADRLISLLQTNRQHASSMLVLAPGNGLVFQATEKNAIDHAEALGFITSPIDPRLRISACIGSDGCISGQIPARRDADEFSQLLKPDKYLHISGCPKGCAYPRPADITLVGLKDGYGLVTDGSADDTVQKLLRREQIGPVLETA